MATTQLMPGLLAAALVNATIERPGWDDGRKIAGALFARMTEAMYFLDERRKLGEAEMHSREALLRVLDNFMNELNDLRTILAEGSGEKLHAKLDNARKVRQFWWQQRSSNKWIDTHSKAPAMPRFGDSIGRLIGLESLKGLLGRPRGDKDSNRNP